MNQSASWGYRRNLQSNAAGLLLTFLLLLSTIASAQAPAAGSTVPTLVNFSGTMTDLNGKPMNGVHGVTFYLYKDSAGRAPLWMETQNVQADNRGHYTVMLGSTTSQGLPKDLFASGEARWLAVQPEGQAEQPPVLLLSVPYALKAADAETIGGLPPSAFVLAVSPAPGTGPGPIARTDSAPVGATVAPPASSNVTTTGGTVNAIPLFSTATKIQNSILNQTGTTAVNVGGKLNLPATGAATATAGKNSRPLDFVASSFSSMTSTAVNQSFQWQAEPAANNTAAPAGTLNLLYGLGATAPAETGLKLSSKGIITFAAGQTFPGTAAGTVKRVGLAAPATDFTVTGSPVTSTGTLNFAWTVAPTSADTANAIVKRDATGSFNATSITGTGTFSSTTANTNAITGSTSLDGGSAIVGSATATGGSNRTYGVTGYSVSTVAGSTGVLGQDKNTTGSGGFTMGVQGVSSNQQNGIGVFGFDGASLSGVFSSLQNSIVLGGVWGDGGAGSGNPLAIEFGVAGTIDDGIAGYFANNSSGDNVALEGEAFDPNGFPFFAYNYATGASCDVDNNGNLNCTGSKNAVVPVDSGKRIVAMSAIEAPQNWFEDAGEAELVNGSAAVTLDVTFTQTVNTDMKYQIFLTPYGDCKGLYVTNRTANSFEVHELGGGTASLSFGYRIMALRRKYESVRFADHTHDLDRHKRMMERMKGRPRPAAAPASFNSPVLTFPSEARMALLGATAAAK